MTAETTPGKTLYVLDTNVLMHDPAAIFRFQEHDIFIPMIVLEEMDNNKKGLTEIARNVRQTSRFLDDLIKNADRSALKNGILISQLQTSGTLAQNCSGRLFFQSPGLTLEPLPKGATTGLNDNIILQVVLALQKAHPEKKVVLVAKDINVRIKSWGMEILAEDYQTDQVVEDADMLYSGTAMLGDNFWNEHGTKMKSWQSKDRTFYKLEDPMVAEWYPNQYLYLNDGSNFEAVVRSCVGPVAVLELLKDYRNKNNNVWGIMAKNREQNFALNMLLDPEIDFVTLLGTAGTGKTLLALATGLFQTKEKKRFTEIIMTRDTIDIGKEIGFLPGTEEEKMAPWMGALTDNLELLSKDNGGKYGAPATDWEQSVSKTLSSNKIKIRSLNFMRGRTFLERFLIIDEAQNLTAKQMKTLITRAGPGTKIICIGNLNQIDTPFLTPTTSGLTYVVDRFKNWSRSAHIIFQKGERSPLADYANEVL